MDRGGTGGSFICCFQNRPYVIGPVQGDPIPTFLTEWEQRREALLEELLQLGISTTAPSPPPGAAVETLVCGDCAAAEVGDPAQAHSGPVRL